MRILVTGGAGYIGSVVVKDLIEKGHEVTVIDNLEKGKKELVDKRATFINGDILYLSFLRRVFTNGFDVVMHFAAYKDAGESMVEPEKYVDNIKGTINLLKCMVEFGVKKIIFSSSAAVYGIPQEKVIEESHPTNPINFYGFTKLESERIIKWFADLKGIRYVLLRYFNVAGDGGLDYVDPDARNIFPVIAEMLTGKRELLKIFGNDYETWDGTCVRDYIHVSDLSEAHILSLELESSEVINLGTGKGYSVLDLVREFEKVAGKKLNYVFSDRRAGDPPYLVASYDKARRLLGWAPRRGLREMVESTLKAYMKSRNSTMF